MQRGDKAMVLCFVEFTDAKCAVTAMDALQGFIFICLPLFTTNSNTSHPPFVHKSFVAAYQRNKNIGF